MVWNDTDHDFEERYNERFSGRWEFERSHDGILLVRFKQADSSVRDAEGYSVPPTSEGGPSLQRSEPIWSQIGQDEANKVVILTGYNGAFYNSYDHRYRPGYWTAARWHSTVHQLPRTLLSFLDLPTLTIGAANGPATVHAEYLLLCDLVVAAESATFQDMPHFSNNTVPGDGVNLVWPMLLGWNRGRDFLLTGRTLSAWDAFELGLVREVVPDEELLPRCYELARQLLSQDEITLRLTAPALRHQLKLQVMTFMQHSVALEGIVFMDQSVRGPR